MTTSRTYKYGKYTCKAYKKAVGHGFEVGFTFGGKTIFVGNFIHTKECNAWWTKMNTECTRFLRRYTLPSQSSTAFFTKFMGNYLYKCYYAWLDTQFTKHNRVFTQALRKDVRKYTNMSKHTTHNTTWNRPTLRRAG